MGKGTKVRQKEHEKDLGRHIGKAYMPFPEPQKQSMSNFLNRISGANTVVLDVTKQAPTQFGQDDRDRSDIPQPQYRFQRKKYNPNRIKRSYDYSKAYQQKPSVTQLKQQKPSMTQFLSKSQIKTPQFRSLKQQEKTQYGEDDRLNQDLPGLSFTFKKKHNPNRIKRNYDYSPSKHQMAHQRANKAQQLLQQKSESFTIPYNSPKPINYSSTIQKQYLKAQKTSLQQATERFPIRQSDPQYLSQKKVLAYNLSNKSLQYQRQKQLYKGLPQQYVTQLQNNRKRVQQQATKLIGATKLSDRMHRMRQKEDNLLDLQDMINAQNDSVDRLLYTQPQQDIYSKANLAKTALSLAGKGIAAVGSSLGGLFSRSKKQEQISQRLYDAQNQLKNKHLKQKQLIDTLKMAKYSLQTLRNQHQNLKQDYQDLFQEHKDSIQSYPVPFIVGKDIAVETQKRNLGAISLAPVDIPPQKKKEHFTFVPKRSLHLESLNGFTYADTPKKDKLSLNKQVARSSYKPNVRHLNRTIQQEADQIQNEQVQTTDAVQQSQITRPFIWNMPLGFLFLTLNEKKKKYYLGLTVVVKDRFYHTTRFVFFSKSHFPQFLDALNEIIDLPVQLKKKEVITLFRGTVMLIKDIYKGRQFIGIRMAKWYNGEPQPTRNGFNLTVSQSKQMLQELTQLNQNWM